MRNLRERKWRINRGVREEWDCVDMKKAAPKEL